MFSVVYICHLIMRYLEMCTCDFCALNVQCGFRVFFCWEVSGSLAVVWFISVQAEIQKYLQPSNPRFKNDAVPCNSSRNKVKAIEQLFIPQH